MRAVGASIPSNPGEIDAREAIEVLARIEGRSVGLEIPAWVVVTAQTSFGKTIPP